MRLSRRRAFSAEFASSMFERVYRNFTWSLPGFGAALALLACVGAVPLAGFATRGREFGMGLLVILFLTLLVIGILPTLGYGRHWDYVPGGKWTLALVVFVLLIYLGYVPQSM
jgi:hypothetical protein